MELTLSTKRRIWEGKEEHGKLSANGTVPMAKLAAQAKSVTTEVGRVLSKFSTVIINVYTFIFRAKFGLFEVDYDDDKRTRRARLSALWYKNLIANRTLDPADVPYFEDLEF